MILRIVIKEGVAFVKRSTKDGHTLTEKKEQVLSDVLQYPLEILDTTFGQFFEFVIREKELFERIFRGATFGWPLQPYIDEIRKDAPPKDPHLYRVEVAWDAQYSEGEFHIFPAFHGWGKWDVPEEHGPEEGGIAMEYTALNEYKNYPLMLDTGFGIEVLDAGRPPHPQGTLELTAYDVLHGILGEITWSGDISKGRKGPDIPPPGTGGTDWKDAKKKLGQ